MRALVLALVLSCAAPAFAAAPSPERVGVEGVGVAWTKDDALLTVTIGHDVFHVTADTALVGSGGERLGFGAIPVARDPEGQLLGVRQAAVSFRAAERRGRLYLEELRLLAH